MSEHGWPDFHDDGSHHEDVHHDDALQHQDDALHHEDLHHEDLPQHDDVHDEDGGYFDHDGDLAPEHDASAADPHEVHDVDGGHDDTPVPEGHDTVVGHDPDALNEPAGAEDVSSFPPILDVGPLPEPVDGFPWIDTGSLGLIDPATLHAAATTPVDPHELAEYAGADLPPGADPWATLSDSDDPATSALAKWWSENS